MEAFECNGRWWLPGGEHAGVAGTLKVSEGGGMHLSVLGPLGEMKGAFSEKAHPVILGSVDKGLKGNEVTLTGTFRTSATIGSSKDARESYHVDRAYFGAQFPDEASFAFKSMSLQLGGLTEWVYKLSGFDRQVTRACSVGETVPLGFYTRREPVRSTIPGGMIIIGLGLRSSFSGTRCEFQETGQVKVTCDSAISADEFQARYGHALRCLMTFVCDRAQTIEECSVWTADAPEQEIRVVGELVQPKRRDGRDDVSWHDMLFTFDGIDFADFIPKWLRLTEAYGDACNVYFSLLYGPPSYLDIKFQNIANAVLLYYERRPESTDRRQEDVARLKEILGALTAPDQGWLLDRIGVNPRPPLRAALDDLLGRHGDLLDPLFGGRRERFTESVLATLEYVARRERDLESGALAGADLYWLTEKLRFLLKACFMHEAGMSRDAIRACFVRNALYQHIHHQQEAQEPNGQEQVIGRQPDRIAERPSGSVPRPAGSPDLEEFWRYLEKESPRGRAVGIAAYFDESLGRLLGDREESLPSKITTAHRRGLLTNNERDDMNEIRKLRNLVVHRIGSQEFHDDEREIVNRLKTWRIAVEAEPQYESLLPAAEDRLLYVATVIASRLGHRTGSGGGHPLAEPEFTDVRSWPPVTDR